MAPSTFLGGLIFLIFFAVIVFVLLFIFWIWMLIDSIKRNFKSDSEKIVWVLVIVLLGFLGAAIYYFVVKVKDKNINNEKLKKK